MYNRQDLRRRILEQLVQSREPLGSGAILDRLHAGGVTVSQPTIGRALSQTDRLGLTSKLANRGREVTDLGRRYLASGGVGLPGQLTDTLLVHVGRATLAELRQALVARLVLEREAARLAAENARPDQIKHLWRIVDSQPHGNVADALGAKSSVEFHQVLSETSGNRFLAAALQLIRTSTQNIKSLMASLGASIGGDSYLPHLEILHAIERRDGAEAERLAGNHMNDFIRYVDGWISGTTGALDGPVSHAPQMAPMRAETRAFEVGDPSGVTKGFIAVSRRKRNSP